MTDGTVAVPLDRTPEDPPAGAVDDAAGVTGDGFRVHLDNFDGPFDLLLSLISKHQLDVTEVALHQVTDDFIAFIRAQGATWELGTATEFLLVAATLLDLKAARLLPTGEVEDEEDLALLEARDLLFARLLQYRAYKLAAAHPRPSSPACSPSRASATRGRCRSSRSSRPPCPRCCSGSVPRSSPGWLPRPSGPGRSLPWPSTTSTPRWSAYGSTQRC
jgi:hypothetical protein